MQHPPYPLHVQKRIRQYHDEVRYSDISFSHPENFERLRPWFVCVEVGVYQGVTSHFGSRPGPRQGLLYLFDTFEG